MKRRFAVLIWATWLTDGGFARFCSKERLLRYGNGQAIIFVFFGCLSIFSKLWENLVHFELIFDDVASQNLNMFVQGLFLSFKLLANLILWVNLKLLLHNFILKFFYFYFQLFFMCFNITLSCQLFMSL